MYLKLRAQVVIAIFRGIEIYEQKTGTFISS